MYTVCFLFRMCTLFLFLLMLKLMSCINSRTFLIFIVRSQDTHLSGSCRRSGLLFNCPISEYVMV